MDNRPIKRVLVLSGGGARGAYQVGVCEYLDSIGWKPDMVLGNSIGATNGAILIGPRYWFARDRAVDTPVRLLKHVWLSEMLNERLYDRLGSSLMKIVHVLQHPERESEAYERVVFEVFRALEPEVIGITQEIRRAGKKRRISEEQVVRWFLELLFGLGNKMLQRPALIRRRGWRRVLRRYVNMRKLRRADAPYFGIATTDVATGALHMFWNRVPPGTQGAKSRIGIRHIVGSSSIPAVYQATKVRPGRGRARYWWDGCLDANVPIGPALDMISSVQSIVVVLQVPWFENLEGSGLPLPSGKRRPAIGDALKRHLDWWMLAPLRSELSQLNKEQRKRVWIVWPEDLVEPDSSIAYLTDPISIIDYQVERNEQLIRVGFDDAARQLRGLSSES